MANEISIEITAKDLASKAFDSVIASLKGMGTAQGLVAAGALTMGAAIVGGLNKAKDAAMKYNQEVKDMMLATGGSAEATSRLIQVADDAAVSYDTLKTAMRLAVKNGVEPTIENIAKLSDEYLKLAPGVDRGQYLMDKFGRSGLNMARMMELGSKKLLEMNAAVEDGLVLTQEAIDASEEYRINVDKITDAWEAFKVSIGNDVIPALNDTIEKQNEYNEAFEKTAEAGDAWIDFNHERRITLYLEQKALYESRDAINAHADALNDDVSAVGAWSDSVVEDYKSILSTIESLVDASEEQTKKIAYNMLIQKMAIDGVSKAEYDMAVQAGVTLGVFTQKTADQAIAMNDMTNKVIDGTLKVNDLGWAINNLPGSKIIDITFRATGWEGATAGVTPVKTHALGGSFVVPSGYGNEGFGMGGMATASAGETVTVGNQPMIDYKKMARAIVTAFAQAGG